MYRTLLWLYNTSQVSHSVCLLNSLMQYPEHHQVGHQGIDVHFRNVPGVLHRAVDLRENFTFSLLHFKELLGHGPQASLANCVELFANSAKSAGLDLCLEEHGDVSNFVQDVLV